MTDKMPDCFCNEEAMTSCDWELTARIRYSRVGDDSATNNLVEWSLDGLPQLLAQVLFQTQIQAMNEKGFEVYAAWLRGCFDGDSPEEMIDRVKALMKS